MEFSERQFSSEMCRMQMMYSICPIAKKLIYLNFDYEKNVCCAHTRTHSLALSLISIYVRVHTFHDDVFKLLPIHHYFSLVFLSS